MAVRAVNFTSTGQVVSNDTRYYGFTVRETAGSAATINLYAGTSNAGDLLESISLAANGSAGDGSLIPLGIYATKGVYAEVTGTIKASVRVG